MPYMRNVQALLKNWIENGLFYSLTDLTAGLVITKRTRFTIAQVNAGATILAAVPGFAYRMIDAFAISIGGAATTLTTLDIIGTQSTAVKLVAFGQAALTENTMVRAGSSGGVILAAGVSFVRNDINTAITIGITGTATTVATHFDIMLAYVVEPEAL